MWVIRNSGLVHLNTHKTSLIPYKLVRIMDLELLTGTSRSAKTGLIIDKSVQIIELTPPLSVKIGLKADESVRID